MKDKDYLVTVKIQNNYLWQKMQLWGIETAAQLGRETGVNQVTVGKILNLKTPAYTKAGILFAGVQKLCNFFSCEVEDLFPQQHIEKSLPTNKMQVQADMDQLMPKHLLEGSKDPAELLSWDQESELVGEIYDILACLTQNEHKVINMRLGLDGESYTLKETGEELGLSRERVRQIEAKAFRKLRNFKFRNQVEKAYFGGKRA
jgi:DNA-binding CsgD family transcriptional regulator